MNSTLQIPADPVSPRFDTVVTDLLSAPVGPFSQGVRANGLIYISGQVAQDSTGKIVGGNVGRQAEQVLVNLQHILHAAGRSFADVVRARVYLTNMSDFGVVNEVYSRYFLEPYPARTTVAVAALPLGAAVEIDVDVLDLS